MFSTSFSFFFTRCLYSNWGLSFLFTFFSCSGFYRNIWVAIALEISLVSFIPWAFWALIKSSRLRSIFSNFRWNLSYLIIVDWYSSSSTLITLLLMLILDMKNIYAFSRTSHFELICPSFAALSTSNISLTSLWIAFRISLCEAHSSRPATSSLYISTKPR